MSLALSVLFIAAAVVFLAVIQQDVTRRRIPNSLPLAIVAIAVLHWVIIGQAMPALLAAMGAGIVLVAAALLFWRGWIGGGDVKLMAAASFLLGSDNTIPFLIYMALLGGIVSLMVLAKSLIFRRPAQSGATSAPTDRSPVTVPYGVAIALAALVSLSLQVSGR